MLLAVTLHAQVPAGQLRATFTHPAMGTEFRLTVAATDTAGLAAVVSRAFARIDTLEQRMSDYRADSELNRLPSSTGWQNVSPELAEVLRFARRLARRSDGAFDPTVGPLSKLWRRAFRQRRFPEQESVQAARTRVHWKDLRVSRRDRVRLRQADMQLDLGGVAKGYALDAAGHLLRAAGYPSFLLDGGGDLLLGYAPPGQTGWTVATPSGQLRERYHDVAIATSGATYRYLEHAGVRYSHLVDPRTGYGITGRRVVTVFAPTATVADGLASALSITKAGKGRRLLRRYRATTTNTAPRRSRGFHFLAPASSPVVNPPANFR